MLAGKQRLATVESWWTLVSPQTRVRYQLQPHKMQGNNVIRPRADKQQQSRADAVFYVNVIPISAWTSLLCSTLLVWPH